VGYFSGRPLNQARPRELSALEQAERRRYGDQAMEALRQALARGYKDRKGLQQDPDLEPLRSREDFRNLVGAEEEAQLNSPRVSGFLGINHHPWDHALR
jgi:hypothetical protein